MLKMVRSYSLQSIERLKLRKQIETLFHNGKAFSVYCLKVVHLPVILPEEQHQPLVKIGFSIPKKRIRRAVKRNKIKRLLREAWRLEKHLAYAAIPKNTVIHCFLIFTGPQVGDFTFPDAQKAVREAINNLIRIYKIK